jgi:uncharacterized protein
MWKRIAIFTLLNRKIILVLLIISTAIMGYFASKVQLSYELKSAINKNSSTQIDFDNFKNIFGENGNLIVLGFTTNNIADPVFFTAFKHFTDSLKNIEGIDEALALPTAVNIYKLQNDSTTVLKSKPIFSGIADSLASELRTFYNLPFYNNILYNGNTNAYLIALRMSKTILRTEKRITSVQSIYEVGNAFAKAQNIDVKYSGLPLIRSVMAISVQKEMQLFLLLSIIITAIILFLFFRSLSAVLLSIITVLAGVVWSMGFVSLLGYKITLLLALIPPLIVVIGIPNCIYFLNKYHQEYANTQLQAQSLVRMVQRMGIVTLFTNVTAAIGFGVFCFTGSSLLMEFGFIATLGIISIFIITLFALPAIFSYVAPPKTKHTHYLQSGFMQKILAACETIVFKNRKLLYLFWGILLAVSTVGIFKLKHVGFMVDDLPKQDKVYTDLKYFEKNFKGIMPFEIWINTKKKSGATTLGTFNKIDELSNAIAAMPHMGKPLSMVEAIKFARQAYYDGDSTSYAVPSSFDIAFLLPYLKMKSGDSTNSKSQLGNIMKSYVDSNRQHTRISINMADVGSAQLPKDVATIKKMASEIFDTSKYELKYTGSSIVYLEGSEYIINSLRDSILYAFLMIFACMVFLFKDWRVVLMSIVANLIPLVITAGIMGWLQVALKPSTVLVFSVALGITVDVTIRFLVAFKQALPLHRYDIKKAVAATIYDTGMSIIYTSLILIAGFLVFGVSHFGGTKALGFLTSLTLLLAMVINLTVLPALLVWMDKVFIKKSINDPLYEVLNEEEDIDLGKLKLE